jgi:hypothetical protein
MLLGGITMLGAVLGMAAPAAAQSLDTYFPNGIPGYDNGLGVTVLTRQRPDYDFPTYHVANAEVSPQVSESLGYNDNLYGSIHPVGSFLDETKGALSANSAFEHSAVGGAVSVDDLRYFSRPTLDETTGTASLGGSYDIGSDRVSAAYSFAALDENPGDIATSGFDKPIAYFVNRFQANYAINMARLILTPAVEYDTWRFNNTSLGALPVIETYRNRDVIQGSLTARYPLSDVDSLLAILNFENSHYVSPIRGIVSPDNNGYSALAGVDFTPSAIWHYRALLGYEVRTFAGNQVSTQTSPIAQVSATYSPTGLTTVTGTLSRVIEDAAQAETAGYIYTTAQLQLDHELYRNILLKGRVTYQRADFIPSVVQAAGSQTIYDFSFGVTWLLNRYARLVASYDLAYNVNAPIAGVNQSNIRNLTMLTLQIGAF